MVNVSLTKSGNDFLIQGKPFDMTTFSTLKDSGLLYWKSGMRGQLWQECSCGKEPVCVMCMKCSKHCTCGGGGWALTEKGVNKIISSGHSVSVDGVPLATGTSFEDVNKAIAEKKAKEKFMLDERRALEKIELEQKARELETKGIYLDRSKFKTVQAEFMNGFEQVYIVFDDYKVVSELGSISLLHEIGDKEPFDISKKEVILFGIHTQVIYATYTDMGGDFIQKWFVPVKMIDQVKKKLVEKQKKRDEEYRIAAEKRKAEEDIQKAIYIKKRDELKAELSSMTKTQIVEKYGSHIRNKSASKEAIVQSVSQSVAQKETGYYGYCQ